MLFDNNAPKPPPPPPDPARALTKVLDAQRKKEEQAAAKKAEAERIAELARLAFEDHGKRALATPFGQSVTAAVRGFAAPTPPGQEGLPAAAVQWPTPPRSFFSDEIADD